MALLTYHRKSTNFSHWRRSNGDSDKPVVNWDLALDKAGLESHRLVDKSSRDLTNFVESSIVAIVAPASAPERTFER